MHEAVAPLKEALEWALNPTTVCEDSNEECPILAAAGKCDMFGVYEECKLSCKVDGCGCAADDQSLCPWFTVFDTFGTHFLDSVDLGGKMIYEATIDESSQETMKESGVSVKAEVEASAFGFSGGASTSVNSNSKSSNSNSNSNINSVVKVFGGIPPEAGAMSDEGFGQWAATIRDHPMPVRYTLSPIWELKELYEHRVIIQKAITEYIAKHSGKPFMKAQVTGGPAGSEEVDRTTRFKLDFLKAGEELRSGEYRTSKNGAVKLILQRDGHLVLKREGTLLWSSNVYGDEGPYTLQIQTDNNLVVYNKDKKAVWDASTHECSSAVIEKLKIQDDGNLVLYSAGNDALWDTGTYGPKTVHGQHHGRRHC